MCAGKLVVTTLALMSVACLASRARGQVTWYVDDDGGPANGCTTWVDACPELQTALSAANPGDEVWVAAGTYRPDFDVNLAQHTGQRAATFQLMSGVAVYGGFDGTESIREHRAGLIHQTILTGDLNGDDGPGRFANNVDNAFHVVTGSGTDSAARLDGFTITAGYGDEGGGMFNSYGSPTIANCRIVANASSDNGAGMYNVNGSSPTVDRCAFVENSCSPAGGSGDGAGMYNLGGSNPTVRHCIFVRNRILAGAGRFGGGMLNIQSDPIVEHCQFIDNTIEGASGESRGAGMHNREGSSPSVTNCLFRGNRVGSSGTTNVHGAGIANSGGSPVIVNCTFSGNIVTSNGSQGGAGVYSVGGSPSVENCVFWGNAAAGTSVELAQISDDGFQTIVEYSDIQGLVAGGTFDNGTNIGGDPLFVDGGGDFRLLPGSPCIDAGDNTAVPPGITTDLNRGPRILDGDNDGTATVDMGAYETPRAGRSHRR